jgi:hypothetical protein
VTGASHEIIAAGQRNDRCDRNLRFGAKRLLVVGNRATAKCETVTSNPVINAH